MATVDPEMMQLDTVLPTSTVVTKLHDLCTKHKLTVTYVDTVVPLPEEYAAEVTAVGQQPGDPGRSSEVNPGSNDQIPVNPALMNEIYALLGDVHMDSVRAPMQQGSRRKKPRKPAPLFEVTVTVGDHIAASGRGRSKKLAKQAAAAVAVEQLEQELKNSSCTSDQMTTCSDDSGQTSDPSSTDPHYNPVGKLQQLTHKLVLPPVRFEFNLEEQGKTHGPNGAGGVPRRVSCTASIYDLHLTCTAVSQKLAKRMASEQMLSLLQEAKEGSAGLVGAAGDTELCKKEAGTNREDNGSSDRKGYVMSGPRNDCCYDPSSKVCSTLPGSETGSETVGRLVQGKRLAPPSAEARRHHDQFFNSLRARTGKTLASLEHMALNRAHTNYVQMLEEISEEQNIDIVYRELPEMSENGEYQCLVQLTCMPVAVCHALGRSRDEARALAAHNALQYLRIVVRKP